MMKQTTTIRLGVWTAALALTVGWAAPALADEWNERTILTFSAPVMVPGATLQPGTYEFRLADMNSSRNLVQVFTNDGQKVVASMMAVPIKRDMASEDVVVQFNPTDRGAPPAIKSWFYPGSQYGHELVYSDEQAREIAERTKTVVLSIDTPGTDIEKGVLRTYDPSGTRAAWRGDPETMREWEAWRQTRASAASAETTAAERRQATAPAVRGDFKAMRVALDDLESNPKKYLGQAISVDAEVEEVLGPRVFTIDERNWGDLDGEILVFMPTTLVALVREDDRVTVTGELRPFVRTELEREWGWFDMDPELEVEAAAKPVLVANRIVGGTNDVALVIDSGTAAVPVGTSGAGASAPALDQVGAVAGGDEELVGRHVNLKNVRISGLAADDGFFVESAGDTLFVLPADRAQSVRAGDTVSVQGVVLRMPDRMEDRLKAPDGFNDDIYVYARQLGQ